jgi:hypothetical protein
MSEDEARAICARNGAGLEVADDRELPPRICREIRAGDDVPAAVRAVAAAIDEIFSAAGMTPEQPGC